MPPSVHFLCLKCESRLGRESGEAPHPCEHCGAPNEVAAPLPGTLIDHCAACSNDQLYFKKYFNRTTGIALVVLGSIFVPWT